MKLDTVWVVRNPHPCVISNDPAYHDEKDRVFQFCSQLSVKNEELFRVYMGTNALPRNRWGNRWGRERTTLYTDEAEAMADATKRMARLRRRYTTDPCDTCKGACTRGAYPHGEWDFCKVCKGSGLKPRARCKIQHA